MTEVLRLPTSGRGGNHVGLWPTVTTQSLAGIIENCRILAQLGLITGPSGVGKTTAARLAVKNATVARDNWLDSLDDPKMVFVAMTKAAKEMQPGLQRIAIAARVAASPHWGAHDVHDALVEHRWGDGSLLVLDEAQFMSDDLLHAIRCLWDELEQRGYGLSIVLVGTPDLAKRIKDRGRRGLAFEPLRGRLGACIELEALEPDDCAAICQHYGLTEKNAETLIRRAATGSGGLHNVRRLIHQAELGAKGKRLAFADLKQAAELTGVAS